MISREKQLWLQVLARGANSEFWIKGLKPLLEEIKTEIQTIKKEYNSSFETAKADIKRTTTLSVVDEIIDQVEKANDRVSNNYRED